MKEFEIKDKEVLRYLGYNKEMQLPENFSSLLAKAKEILRKVATPKATKGNFSIEVVNNTISFVNTNLELESKQLAKLLCCCKKAAILAVTLGAGVDQLIQTTALHDLTLSVVLDACATTLIEEVCDLENNKIKQEANNNNTFTTPRFSPGYGDLPLSVQPDILTALMAQKTIGLTANEDYLLFPRKSVTAIIGISEIYYNNKKNCEVCNLKNNCPYQEEGDAIAI